MTRIAVLGGGPAGLLTALLTARAGHAVVLFERQDHVGGLAASTSVAGIRVDRGSHRLHPATPAAVMALLHGLPGLHLQRRPRRGRIRLAEEWIAFPLTPGDLVRRLPPGLIARLAVDAVTGPLRRRRGTPRTFAEAVRAGLGPTMLEVFYGPFARKVWGREPADLDVEHARSRISAGTPGAVLRRVVGRRSPDAGTFWYPRGGFGRIPEALADAAAAAGAELRLGAAVTAVDPVAGVVAADGAVEEVDVVCSTLPLPLLARLAGAEAEAARLGDAVGSRALALVYLVVPTRPYAPVDAHYLPASGTPVARVSEPSNYRDDPDDPDDRTVLCVEIPCTAGDATWSAADGDLGAVALDGLAAADLPVPEVEAVTVDRVPAAYPVFAPGGPAALATLAGWADLQPRLLTFGRHGRVAHDNTHHALDQALAAASSLRDGGIDRRAWAAERERFTGFVVED